MELTFISTQDSYFKVSKVIEMTFKCPSREYLEGYQKVD